MSPSTLSCFAAAALLLLAPAPSGAAAFRLYTTLPGQPGASSAPAPSPTTPADSTRLIAPAPPSPALGSGPGGNGEAWYFDIPANTDAVNDNSATTGLLVSRPQRGNFFGLSIELSVVNRILGTSSDSLAAPFLNYMAALKARAGVGPLIRIGGNSQEASEIFPQGLESGGLIEKTADESESVTPQVDYSIDLLYAMGNISDLVGASWVMGLDFSADPNDQSKAEEAYKLSEDILGSRGFLHGVQMGNEPDLYSYSSNRRNGTWDISTYETQLTAAMNKMTSDDSSLPMNNFMLPSVCCSWTPDQMLESGLLDTYAGRMNALSFQKYATSNCDATDRPAAQTLFPQFLNHTLATSLVTEYIAAAKTGYDRGLEVIMSETNSASCSGFAGLSDSFGIAMWLIDWALTLAYRDFSSALLHVGGQSAFYNPFTPPQTNETNFRQWTTGSPYYSMLVVSEVFGSSNNSQIVDLTGGGSDTTNQYNPAYAVYENGQAARVVLFNYASDVSGANDATTVLDLTALSTVPASVRVRYLRADSVADQSNITWAGQTLGGDYDSDGMLHGARSNLTAPCDTEAKSCTIKMYAPSVAIVFLSEASFDESTPADGAVVEYTSTVGSGATNTRVAPEVLQTSNGHGGSQWTVKLGSTSNEQKYTYNAAIGRVSAGGVVFALVIAALGAAAGLL